MVHLSSVCLLLLAAILGMVTTVLSECPRTCSCTPPVKPTSVNCALLKFDHVPDNIPKTVRSLDLSENWIETLPSTLSKYPHLRRLNMSGNRLSSISNSTFNGLGGLIHLDLSKNKIASFRDINGFSFLRSNENLNTLNLSYNLIQRFDSYDSISSDSLEILDISNCRINYLDDGSLDGLPNLTHLNVSKNPIKWLTEVDPLRAQFLTYLDMSYCQLDSIRRNALEGMPKLQTLILSRNKQLNLDSINILSTSLIHFEAEYCQFKRPALSDFPNLVSANLRGNKIDSLRAKTFLRNLKLKRLDLSENHLSRVWRDAFLGLNEIESINLARNDIKEITWDMFATNFELKHLNLSHNAFSSFPANLTVAQLKTLSVSMCNIQYLDADSLARLPHLISLDLSNNLIKSIPNNIESNSLKDFDLSSGHLSSINNDTFAKLPSLEQLNLKGNRFTSIPKSYMFTSNPALRSVELSDNPWICDCKDDDFKRFWKYLTDVPSKLANEERKEMKCSSPEKLSGRSWENACYEELYPSERAVSFFDHYGVYLLIIAMTASFLLLIAVTIRQRMLKRDKVIRGNMEARRRLAVRENQERRMFQQYLESSAVSIEVDEVQQEQPPEREVSQPPTYEEAILMPCRETTSLEELDVLEPADSAEGGQSSAGASCSRDEQEPSRHLQKKTAEGSDCNELEPDYDDVAEEEVDRQVVTHVGEEEEEEEQSPRHALNPEEVQLIQQLRIEVWSREDIDTLHHSDSS